LTLFAGAFAYGYYRFDRHILPLVLASADLELKTVINSAIYTEVQKIIRDRGVDASDFYINSLEPGGGNVLAVNTVLVNDICNSAALAISDKLSGMEPAPVSVPVGMAFGLDTLANAGPEFTFRLRPTGNALVNYETKFEAVGINQVHFMVWLTVVSTVKIINPVQSATVTVTREVSLVDTVITGTVPDTYLGMEQGLSVTPSRP
jgi:sporulation protein YunB